MKKIILTLFLFLFLSNAYSQVKKINYGFLILNNLDTLKGYFINKPKYFNTNNLDFIIGSDKEKIFNYKPEDFIMGKSKEKNILSIIVKTTSGFKKIIVEPLIIGKFASLYKSYNLDGEELLYIKKDTTIYEISQKFYIGAINTLFGDCEKFQIDIRDYNNTNVTPYLYKMQQSDNKISTYKYDESVFSEFVIKYNSCLGASSDFQIIKKSPIIIRTGALIGITSNNLSFNNEPYSNAVFNGNFSPSFGFFSSITYKERIAFQVDLVYKYLNSSTKYTTRGTILNNNDFTVTDINSQLDYKIHLLQVPLSLKLNLFKLSNFQPFIKGGLAIDIAFINNSEATASPVSDLYTSSYNDKIDYPTFNSSVFCGIGINMHNKKNNKIYFIDFEYFISQFYTNPIISYDWVTNDINGTFKYFNLRVGRSF